ncbi:hypothetical protein D3C84_852070 [compost metagenome]
MPLPLMATVPLAPWVTLVTGLLGPSTSLSLASTSMITALSSLVVALSLATTVASLSGLTVTVTAVGAVSAMPSVAT